MRHVFKSVMFPVVPEAVLGTIDQAKAELGEQGWEYRAYSFFNGDCYLLFQRPE